MQDGKVEEEYGIRIARDGTWFHDGDPIRRIELVKLFSTVLRRDAAGDYWLITPVERGRIAVEDVPFIAVEMRADGHGTGRTLSFRTNLDEWVEAGPDHPIRVSHNPASGEPTPYITIRGGLEARIARPVYYELVGHGVVRGLSEAMESAQTGPAETGTEETGPAETGEEIGVWSRGTFFVLGRLSEA